MLLRPRGCARDLATKYAFKRVNLCKQPAIFQTDPPSQRTNQKDQYTERLVLDMMIACLM